MYDDPRLEKIVMLIGERLDECIEGRHLPIRDCKLPGMKGGWKYWVIWAKFQNDGKDEFIILLLNFTQLQLEHQELEFGEEVIHGFEVAQV